MRATANSRLRCNESMDIRGSVPPPRRRSGVAVFSVFRVRAVAVQRKASMADDGWSGDETKLDGTAEKVEKIRVICSPGATF